MLSLMRKHAASWIIKIALFIIIIVFIFWGGYSYTSRRASYLAKVNDHYITISEYNKTYDNLVENYKRQFKGNVPENLFKALNLKRRALDLLIERYLLNSITKRLGLRATKEEIRKSINRFSIFKVNGRFSPERYNRILMRVHLTPEVFESQQAQEISVDKLQRIVVRNAKVSGDEIKAYFHYSNDEVKLAYIAIDPSDFEVKKNPKKIKDYFERNREKYLLPEKRQFAMVLFKYSDLKKEIKPSESEITYYYQEHKKNFYKAKEIRARHILFLVPPHASKKQMEKIKRKALHVLNLAKQGVNFATLAKKYSEDKGSSSRGGDLGFFTFNEMIKPFATAAFSLKAGEISNLVKTQFGYHIIKVEAVRKARQLPLDEVKSKIIEILKHKKAKDLAMRKATDFSDFAFSIGNLKHAAEEKKIPVIITSSVSMSDALPLIGRQPQFMHKLFQLGKSEISQEAETNIGVVVAQVLKIEKASVPDFKTVEEDVTKDWQSQEEGKLAEQKAGRMLKEVKNRHDLTQVAKLENIPVKKVDWFSRYNPNSAFSGNVSILNSIFSRTQKYPFPNKPFELRGDWIIYQVTDWKRANESDLKKKERNIYLMLLSQKQKALWYSWLQEMKREANIKILRKY